MTPAADLIRYPGNVPGLLYEPRALWSIARVDTSENAPGRLVLPREHFLNGGKYPITLTHITLAPIGFTFVEYDDGDPLDQQNFRNCGAASLAYVDLLITMPQRQNFVKHTVRLSTWTPEPHYTPKAKPDTTPDPAVVPSSLWGVTRWMFDHPMIVPKLGDLEFQLSSFTNPGAGIAPSSIDDVPDTRFSVAFFEGPPYGPQAPDKGKLLFPGNARLLRRERLRTLDPFLFDVAGMPIQPDAFGTQTYNGLPAPTLTGNLWPPDQQLSAKSYGAQNATQDGSTAVQGFAVMIDQLDYDADITAQANTTFQQVSPRPLTPLALRVSARARMRNGGTGEFWWRQGAPLALVCPSTTPAQVYRLPCPVTLAPGDSLQLEVQAPPAPVVLGQVEVDPLYQVGVGMCGFAAIEG